MGCVFCVHLASGVFPDAGALVKDLSRGNFQGPERGGGLSAATRPPLPANICINSPKARQAPGQNLGDHILGARGRRKGERASYCRYCRTQGACRAMGVTVPISLCFENLLEGK